MAGGNNHSNILMHRDSTTTVAAPADAAPAFAEPVDLAPILVGVMHAAMLALMFWSSVGYLMLMLA